MLIRITVENYALIDKLEMELDRGLNIITGETGAGKSILLGALGLLLGNKNDGSAMKDNTKNCVVEGVFDLSGRNLTPFFEQNEMDYAAQTTIRRIITPAGKSRSFVNDAPVQLTQLKELGARLIDIHSQHQNLILSSEEFRIEAIDTVAGNSTLLAQYDAVYTLLADLRRRLLAVEDTAAHGRNEQEWLCYQVEELTIANLRDGEQQELEQEQATLSDADRISEVLAMIHNSLDEEQTGVLAQLKTAKTELSHIQHSYPQAENISERLYSTLLELKDIEITIGADVQRIESNPERLQIVNNRLDTLYSLMQKHRVATIGELVALRDSYIEKLNAITNSDEQIAILRAEIEAQTAKAKVLAEKLHAARAKAAPDFGKRIVERLMLLGMPDAQFNVDLTPTNMLTRTGCDTVEFLFTANRNTSPQSVERIASGGEMSRVMLSLKALLAERMQLPTIIFDEIDSGVSGRIADAMGVIIEQLSERMQVIDITHLPQVASKGSSHFVVYKQDGRTDITRLTDDQRVTEIAKMLSGSEITAAAIAQAKMFLEK